MKMNEVEANIKLFKFLGEPDTIKLMEILKKENGGKKVWMFNDGGDILLIKDLAEYYALWLEPNEKGIDFIEELNRKINEKNKD